jgi:hypothetical protein
VPNRRIRGSARKGDANREGRKDQSAIPHSVDEIKASALIHSMQKLRARIFFCAPVRQKMFSQAG